MWDAGEYIAAAKSLGIPHQPGNPVYVLVAHVAGMVPVSPSYATRINVLAALCSAVTAALWFLVAERLLRARVTDRVSRLVAAGVCALLGATAFTVWNQSVVMEKVYPLALVTLALTSLLLLRWFDTPEGRGADRLLVLMAYLVGLGYAIHPAGLLAGPAIAIAVMRYRPRTIARGKLIAALAGAFVFGATPFAVLPIRAAHQPYINESQVSACEKGKIELACTFSAETVRRLVGTIQREQYGGNPVSIRRAPFKAQLQMYWLYFKWQWMRDAAGRTPLLQALVAAVMLVLGVAGLVAIRDTERAESRNVRARSETNVARPYLWYFLPLAVSFTIALIYYLNFRYGASQSPELAGSVDREPRDRDYFFMWTFSLWGLLAGLGVSSLLAELRAAGRGLRLGTLCLVALVPLAANYDSASRRGQAFTSSFAADMLASVEPNGVIITNGDNDSFPLWYAQSVEGLRPDVTIALTPYLGMEWYARQLNLRKHIWKLSDAELDTVPGYMETKTPVVFQHGTINATIPPGILTRDQLLVLRAIKDSFPNRSIYFSFGPYPQQLGLAAYVKRVGLIQKLEPEPVRETLDTMRTQSGEVVDVPRSLELWKQFRGPAQLLRERKWVDAASSGVPLYYAVVAQDLAIALDARGDTAQASQIIGVARQVVEALR